MVSGEWNGVRSSLTLYGRARKARRYVISPQSPTSHMGSRTPAGRAYFAWPSLLRSASWPFPVEAMHPELDQRDIKAAAYGFRLVRTLTKKKRRRDDNRQARRAYTPGPGYPACHLLIREGSVEKTPRAPIQEASINVSAASASPGKDCPRPRRAGGYPSSPRSRRQSWSPPRWSRRGR